VFQKKPYFSKIRLCKIFLLQAGFEPGTFVTNKPPLCHCTT
jgi:hypothetical protein